jgi:hypothetical protein
LRRIIPASKPGNDGREPIRTVGSEKIAGDACPAFKRGRNSPNLKRVIKKVAWATSLCAANHALQRLQPDSDGNLSRASTRVAA